MSTTNNSNSSQEGWTRRTYFSSPMLSSEECLLRRSRASPIALRRRSGGERAFKIGTEEGCGESEPLRVCRRLHVWMPRVMQAVFEHFRHAIGCGHVSGLKLRREPYRGPSWRYADQVQINSMLR